MLTDTLANALTHLLHMEQLGRSECTVQGSEFMKRVLSIFQQEGYLGDLTEKKTPKGTQFTLKLTGKINKCGVIKPRFPVTNFEILKFEKRYLPAAGFGILVVSTSKGLMTHKQSQENNLGGKLIAYCY